MRFIPDLKLNIILLLLLFTAGRLSARGWHVAPDGKDYTEYTPAQAGDYFHPLKLEFVLANKSSGGGLLVSPGDTVWVHGNLYNFSENNHNLHYKTEDYTPYTGYYEAPLSYKNHKAIPELVPVSKIPYSFFTNHCFSPDEIRPEYDSGRDYNFKIGEEYPDPCTGNLKKDSTIYHTHIKGYTILSIRFPSLYISKLQGSSSGGSAAFNGEKPVIVRAYGNERVAIDGSNILQPTALNCFKELAKALGKNLNTTALLVIKGQYTYFWGIEFTNSCRQHISHISEGRRINDIEEAGGVDINGKGNRVINCVVHNLVSGGVSSFSTASQSKIDGCVIYNDGWSNTSVTDRAHGHGIYSANNPDSAHSFKEIENNFLFDCFDMGMHIFKTDKSDGPITGFKIHDNIIFNNGKIATKIIPSSCGSPNGCLFDLENPVEWNGVKYYQKIFFSYTANFILGGHSGMKDVDVFNNHCYQDLKLEKNDKASICDNDKDFADRTPDNFVVRSQGSKKIYDNVNIENNVLIGGTPAQLEDLRHSRFRNNFMYGNKKLLEYIEGVDSNAFAFFPDGKYHHYDLNWNDNSYVYDHSYFTSDSNSKKHPLVFFWTFKYKDTIVNIVTMHKKPVFKTYTFSSDLIIQQGATVNFSSSEFDGNPWQGFQSTLGLEYHPAWYSDKMPTDWNTPKEFFMGGQDSGRKEMLVYNLGGKPADYYFSKLDGLVPIGHQFRIRDVQDYYNKAQQFTGTYTGIPVPVELRYSVSTSTSNPPGAGKLPKTKEYPGNGSYDGYVKNFKPEISGITDGVNNVGDSFHTGMGFNTFILEFAPAFSLEAKNLGDGRYEVSLKNAEGYIPGNFEWSNSNGLKMEAGSTPGSRIITVKKGKCVTISATGNYFYNGLSGTEKMELCNK